MHENRETSGTSRSNQDRDRSEKAISRTAGRQVPEESDRAVVPVNLPNKEEQSSAEAEEERARTKENIAQSNTHPTQSGKGVSQRLRGVRQAAKERKQEQFTALLHHLKVDLLRDSFYALKRQAAPGVDGVTWKEYENGLEGRLADLHSRVHRGAYRAQPSRRVYIPMSRRIYVLLVLATVGAMSFAQVAARTVAGVVTDDSGAVVANADVTLTLRSANGQEASRQVT